MFSSFTAPLHPFLKGTSKSKSKSKSTSSKKNGKRNSTAATTTTTATGVTTRSSARNKKLQQLPPPQEQPEDLSVKGSRKKPPSSASQQQHLSFVDQQGQKDNSKTGSCASTRCRKGRGKGSSGGRGGGATSSSSTQQQRGTSSNNSSSGSSQQQRAASTSTQQQHNNSSRSAAAAGGSAKSTGGSQHHIDVENFLLPQQYVVAATSSSSAASSAAGRTLEQLAAASTVGENPLTGGFEAALPPFLLRHSMSAAAREAASGGSGGMSASNATTDSDQDDSDMSRLQALLEARNMPIPTSTLLTNLGPRIQQILHRPATSSASAKANQLIEVMKSPDESRQLQAVIEMCQILVMGNEDTLTGFPIRTVIPILINLLKVEHNFELMNHACRAISYMMEALPRSTSVAVSAVPALLQKLQVIQCMDVAEQSLDALEQLSRHHSSAILNEDGFNACLMFIDFFSVAAQRTALKVAANCCCCTPSSSHAAAANAQLTPNQEFQNFFAKSIPMLVEKLSHQDKKCLESICLCFARLVDQYQTDVSTLKQLGEYQLLENFQNLLVVTPPLIGSHTFVMVIKTMYQICSPCPELANRLVRNSIADTLQCLLCGSTLNLETTSSQPTAVNILPRSPQELFEITALIRELMPKLPTNETVFTVDTLLTPSSITGAGSKSLHHSSGKNIWQWQDDDGSWKNYSKADSRKIETVRMCHHSEVDLLINGRSYTIDFSIMQQINEDSGQARPVRKIADTSASTTSGERSKSPTESDLTRSRSDFTSKDKEIIAQLVRSLFKLLYEVFSTSAGSPPVRQNCVTAIKKMIYYAEPELLEDILKDVNISSNLTSMLSSSSLDMIAAALQISILLMEKLFKQFQSLFQRQGVVYQIAKLLEANNKIVNDVEPCGTSSSGGAAVASSSSSLTAAYLEELSSSDHAMEVTKRDKASSSRYRTSKKKSSASGSSHKSSTHQAASSSSNMGFAVLDPAQSSSRNVRASDRTKKRPASSSSAQSNSRSSNRIKSASTSHDVTSSSSRHTTSGHSLSKSKSSSTSSATGGQQPNTSASAPTFHFPPAAATAPSSSKSSRSHSKSASSAASLFNNLQPPWSRMLASSSSGGSSSSSATNPPQMFAPPSQYSSRKSYTQHLKRHPLLHSGVPFHMASSASTHKLNQSTSRRQENDRKIKSWIREQAASFLEKYFPSAYQQATGVTQQQNSTTDDASTSNADTSLFGQLTSVAALINGSCKDMDECVKNIGKLRDVVTSSDASPFELQHSGVIGALFKFLTHSSSNTIQRTTTTSSSSSRRRRHGDDNVTQMVVADDTVVMETDDVMDQQPEDIVKTAMDIIPHYDRLRCFLHVFANLPMTEFSKEPVDLNQLLPVSSDDKDGQGGGQAKMMAQLVTKLNMCVSQLEQLPVKVHDVSALGNRSEALTYFTRNQLKCHLQRHPDSPKLKQWHNGSVRVDPLAMVSAIEKYLVNRGFSVPMQGSDTEEELRHKQSGHHSRDHDDDDDEDTDDEIDESYEQHHQAISSTSATSQASSNKQQQSQRQSSTTTNTSAATSNTSTTSSSSPQSHRLELYINGHALQTNMTVYQAIKKYSRDGVFNSSSSTTTLSTDHSSTSSSGFLSDSIHTSAFWSMIHVIHYKHVPVESSSSSSVSRCSSSSRSKTNRAATGTRSTKRPSFHWSTGKLNWRPNYIAEYVKKKSTITENDLANDPAKEVLSLLKVIYGLSRYWHMLYTPTSVKTPTRSLLPSSEFLISKLSAKCTRQVQDPLMIMTGEIPGWVGELARTFPFVLPFETRQLVFRIVSFDRDRAMHYLIESGKMNEINNQSNYSTTANTSSASGGGSSHHDSSSRFTNSKVDKKKYVVRRENLLNQAEKLMMDHAHQKHIIEVQYEGESGTGLGPTQEFYTLAGNQLQRCNLSLWRNDQYGKSSPEPSVQAATKQKTDEEITADNDVDVAQPPHIDPPDVQEYVHSSVGLFPRPTATKSNSGKKNPPPNKNLLLNKFRFLGRLLAKALIDNRLVDLPLSPIFYKWLLPGHDDAITWHDLEQVDPQMSLTFFRLMSVLHQKEIYDQQNKERHLETHKIDVDEYDQDVQKQNASLTVDGCTIEALSLDFQLPGFPEIDMIKNGSKTEVTLKNIDLYLNLFAYWTLYEGIRHQMEAVRSGFNAVLPLNSLQYFYPDELDQLFCGARYKPWTEEELADACRTDHGYTLESQTVKFLFQVLSAYDGEEQGRFLQFVTGSPHLPIGGLRAMNPRLTIVRKTCGEEGGQSNPDEYLPSVMTCVNYLKLPEYSSKKILQQRFYKAVHEGQQSFLLS